MLLKKKNADTKSSLISGSVICGVNVAQSKSYENGSKKSVNIVIENYFYVITQNLRGEIY